MAIEITSDGEVRFASRRTPGLSGLGNVEQRRPVSDFGAPETALRTALQRFLARLGWDRTDHLVVVFSGPQHNTARGVRQVKATGWHLEPQGLQELAGQVHAVPLIHARARTLQAYKLPALAPDSAASAEDRRPCWLLIEEGSIGTPCLVYEGGQTRRLAMPGGYGAIHDMSWLTTAAYAALPQQRARRVTPPLPLLLNAMVELTPARGRRYRTSTEQILSVHLDPQGSDTMYQMFCSFAAVSVADLMVTQARIIAEQVPNVTGIAIGTSAVLPLRAALRRYGFRDRFAGASPRLREMPIWTPRSDGEIREHALAMPFGG